MRHGKLQGFFFCFVLVALFRHPYCYFAHLLSSSVLTPPLSTSTSPFLTFTVISLAPCYSILPLHLPVTYQTRKRKAHEASTLCKELEKWRKLGTKVVALPSEQPISCSVPSSQSWKQTYRYYYRLSRLYFGMYVYIHYKYAYACSNNQ